jgi:hypothetical protein
MSEKLKEIKEIIFPIVKEAVKETALDKRWGKYIKRNEGFEKELNEIMSDFFKAQVEEIMAQIDDEVVKQVDEMLGIKGGPGSGSWNGPNSPRFAYQGKPTPHEEIEELKEKLQKKGISVKIVNPLDPRELGVAQECMQELLESSDMVKDYIKEVQFYSRAASLGVADIDGHRFKKGGEYNPKNKTIKALTGMTQTFFHELGHAEFHAIQDEAEKTMKKKSEEYLKISKEGKYDSFEDFLGVKSGDENKVIQNARSRGERRYNVFAKYAGRNTSSDQVGFLTDYSAAYRDSDIFDGGPILARSRSVNENWAEMSMVYRSFKKGQYKDKQDWEERYWVKERGGKYFGTSAGLTYTYRQYKLAADTYEKAISEFRKTLRRSNDD